MKKQITVTIIFIFCLVVLLPLGLTFGIKYVPSGTQPPLGNTQKIYKDVVLAQSFVSLENNLSGIGVSIKNPNFANKKNLNISLLDNENKLVRSIVLNGKNIGDGDFVKIIFQTLDDSKGREFTWVISSPESEYEDALEIFLTDKPATWSLKLEKNNELVKETLPFVTLHSPKNRLQLIITIISDFFAKFREDKMFFSIYTLIILTNIGIITYLKSAKKKV